MRKIVFDIETTNFFSDVGSSDPASLDLACVCIYDSISDSYGSYTQENIKDLFPILDKTDIIIGFNSDHFDIPLLEKYYGKPISAKSVDLLKEVRKSLGRRIKLDTLAEATLGRNKTADGIQANIWWKKGDHKKVIDYCIEDVKITKEIYDYARKFGKLKYTEKNQIKEIPIDANSWETLPQIEKTASLFG
jgi:DEAD/DEAH box helicase domain-containing protein